LVPIAVPDEVQAGAGAELDEIEQLSAGPLRDAQEERRQQPRTLDLIRLHALGAAEVGQKLAMGLERIVPGSLAAEDEVVQTSEQAERLVPPRLAADDLLHHRIVRIAPTELGVERRA